MTELLPPPRPPLPWTRRIIVSVFVVGAVIVMLLILSEVQEASAAHHAALAEQVRIKALEKKQKPFLTAALSYEVLLYERMNADRIRRVQIIAESTGLPPVLVNEKFGWFTGLDDSIAKTMPPPEGIDQISWWGFQQDLAKRFIALSPPLDPVDRVGKTLESVGGIIHLCDEYLAMTTEQAVGILILRGPNRSVQPIIDNPTPYESKYDRIGNETIPAGNAFDEFLNRIVMRPQIALAWLIEREMLASPGSSLELAASKVMEFVAQAIDRRISFTIKGLGPVGKAIPPFAKPTPLK